MYGLKRKLSRGEMVLGIFVSEVRNPNLVHILKQGGFDFFILDNEHGTYDYQTMSAMIAAARGAGMGVVVRVPEIRREAILKPLDAGASGILVPMVDTPEQAREVLQHAKYPPVGNRGTCIPRPHNLYVKEDLASYLAQANQDTLIVMQAETGLSVNNAEKIAATEGVDCIFIGPMDLSVNLGFPGQGDHPRQIEAIESVFDACRKQKKACGVLVFSLDEARTWIDKGMRFVVYSSEIALLAEGAAQITKKLREMTV